MDFKENFNKVAIACKKIILEAPTRERIALSYLHVRNAHPSSIINYDDLLNGKSGITTKLKIYIKSRAQLMRSLFRREQLYYGDELHEKCDILFISHFTNLSQAESGQDTYYGTLPVQLKNHGFTSVIAHVNHTWCRWESIKSSWKKCDIRRVILSRTLDFRQEKKILEDLTQEARSLLLSSNKDDFSKTVIQQVNIHANSGPSAMALRTSLQIAELTKRLKPKYIIATFEGHGWERLSFHAAKDINSQIKCIGYHHTVLFPQQHALGNSYKNNFDPDAIVTAGEVSRTWFSEQTDWKKTPISVLGSVRTAKAFSPKLPKQKGACLVVPEGIVSEATYLFLTALEAAKNSPELSFRLRLHPVLDRKSVLKAAPALKKLPSNVVWSECSLEKDFEQSSSTLYRGSTVVLTAVLSGLQPIYCAHNNETISIDPLAALHRWKKSISHPSMLIAIMKEQNRRTPEDQTYDYKLAKEYCEQYFCPMSKDTFLNLVESLAH